MSAEEKKQQLPPAAEKGKPEERKTAPENAAEQEVRGMLSKMEGEFKKALPKHIPAEKFIRVAITAIITKPEIIAKCSRASVYAAVTKAAQDGLLPDGREGAIVPFWNKESRSMEATWMPMVRGLYKKVRASGEIAYLKTEVVYEHDHFDFYTDEQGDHLYHKPLLDGDRGDLLLTYCISRVTDGDPEIEIMTRDQVMAVRAVSKAKDGPAWSGDFVGEMWRKAVFRRAAKHLPQSTELEQVFARDDENYELGAGAKEVKAAIPPGGSRMRALVAGQEQIPLVEPRPQAAGQPIQPGPAATPAQAAELAGFDEFLEKEAAAKTTAPEAPTT